MLIRHSIDIAAARPTVFARYADVASWPAWDDEVLAVELPGLVPGVEGWLTPRNGPRARIRVLEVVRDRSFTVESALPFCAMRVGHELEGDDARTKATHWVGFKGPLAPLFRRVIGGKIDRSLPQTLAGLKRACEARGERTSPPAGEA